MGDFATWLNNSTLPEFSDLTKKQFIFINETVKPVASEMYNYVDLTSHNEPSKRFDELDVETFASTKLEGENAAKARAGVGLSIVAQLKFLLINGENLKTAVKRFMATLRNLFNIYSLQLT